MAMDRPGVTYPQSSGVIILTLPFCYRWRPAYQEELTCDVTADGTVRRRDGEVVAVVLNNTASSADPAVTAMLTPNPRR